MRRWHRKRRESVALGAGRSAGGCALRDDHGATLGISRMASALSLDQGDDPERAEHSGRPHKKEGAEGHPCTKGPGDFRYFVLIASSAQYVSAPIVIV